MIDDPISYEAFTARFSTEQACIDALFAARWPNGFRCPHCSHSRFYVTRSRRLPLYECAFCHRQTSLISGTVMEGSSTSLCRWFRAIYLLSQPSGISSTDLRDILGVTYKTAWLISHKIRHAMSLEIEKRVLSGHVRIEHFDYGPSYYLDARHPLLLVAAMNDRHQPEQIRVFQPSPEHVIDEERRITKDGLEVCQSTCTDGANVVLIPRAGKSLPALRLHKINIRQWLNGTFCGIGPKHLQAYLNEYCFRSNRQAVNLVPGSLFPGILMLCSTSPVLPYPVLTRYKPVLQPPWKKYESKAKWRGRWLRVLSA